MLRTLKEVFVRLLWLVPIPILWMLLVHFDLLTFLENMAMDWRFRVRGELESPAKVIYIDMDPATIETYGQSPWNRELFANVAWSAVKLGGAKSIFFDFAFSPVTATTMVPDATIRESDLAMTKVTRELSSKIIMAVSFSNVQLPHMHRPSTLPLIYNGNYDPETNAFPEGPTFPIWNFNWGTVGMINTDPRMSGGSIERWVPMFVEVGNEAYALNFIYGMGKWYDLPEEALEITDTNFRLSDEKGELIKEVPRVMPHTFYASSLGLILAYQGLAPAIAVRHFDDRLEITDYSDNLLFEIPLVHKQMVEINWFTHWKSPLNPRVSMLDVLGTFDKWVDGSEEDKIVAEEWFGQFENAIVLVGPTDPFLQDLAPTPFDRHNVPRVGVHGNMVKTILSGLYIKHLPVSFTHLLIIALTTIVALLATNTGRYTRTTKLFAGFILVVFVYIVFWAFEHFHNVVPLVAPVGSAISTSLIGAMVQLLIEERQKGRIKGMFGTYLSPELVTSMIDSGEEPQLGGENAIISAYFSDVQSFSAFSEKLSSEGLVELMNEYLTAMTDILMEEGCYVDKYIGDAIVGIFNKPVALEDHALRACVASQLMQIRQIELREKWKSEGDKWPTIVGEMQTRMGVNTGDATVGNMGSEKRFNYTMMGDTVNLAARCESGAKA